MSAAALPVPVRRGWAGRHGPLLIAEIGGNHEGDFAHASALTDLAVAAGADVVKFQIYYAAELVNRNESPDRFEHFTRFELTPDQHVALAERCLAAGVEYLASVWSIDALAWIDPYLSMYKIGSGDLTAHEVLRAHAERGKPIALSTGLSTLDEVQRAVAAIREVDERYHDPANLAVLQCTSTYPLPKRDANLRAMRTLGAATGAAMGYSDHTTDSQALEAAVAMGAEVLEFHFTDTKDGKEFRDHFVSLTPAELEALIGRLDDLALLLGDGVKQPLPSEVEAGHPTSFRRGVYFARDLAEGSVITADDLCLLRPAHGLAADRFGEVLGRRTTRAVRSLDRVELAELGPARPEVGP